MTRRFPAGRTLAGFLVALALVYGLVALVGTWQPRLGLDLQGGTMITLVAEGEASADDLEEAREVLERRVDSSGAAESEVVVQGDSGVVVRVPGQSRRDLVSTLARQGKMRLRFVVDAGPGVPRTPADDSASPSPTPSAGPDGTEEEEVDPFAFKDNPGEEWRGRFEEFGCGESPGAAVEEDPDRPLLSCGDDGRKYLLSPTVVDGADLDSASTRAPGQQAGQWAVTLDFDRSGTDDFTDMSRALAGTQDQFAVVVDGRVVTASTMTSIITNGQPDLTGDFDEAEAQSLATSLEHGALPVSFEQDPAVEVVGPSLAGDQLRAGLAAGAVGLLLVMLYCLVFYRGIGLVMVASLLAAAGLVYGLAVLLGQGIGFTITLPAIAGFAVAIGVTADSFIVFFERIRDGLRDGMSLSLAVERGWARARTTCLAADAVALLAAVVLYVFATGVVQGFALALALGTVADLAVLFLFTRPTVALLAEKAFFRTGHRWSGLSRESLGVA